MNENLLLDGMIPNYNFDKHTIDIFKKIKNHDREWAFHPGRAGDVAA